METRLFTAHIPLPLANKLDRWTRRLNRSPEWIVTQALAAWVEQEEERERLTLDALSDVESGRVIDNRAVQTWADCLPRKGA